MQTVGKTPTKALALLWVLYFVQGLPYGFQVTALPTLLRASGYSLTEIGFLSALSLPWMLKVVWGPLVDRFGSEVLGRRRSWILPLQLGLGLACLCAMAFPPEEGLRPLLTVVFLMNLFAATMDVAVDGLAVDTLREEDLGKGNIAQVVGFKFGILTGGGLLLALGEKMGWEMQFCFMATMVFGAFALTWATRPKAAVRKQGRTATSVSLSSVFAKVSKVVTRPGFVWLLLAIVGYKFGETLIDSMFKPFLVDAGFSVSQIGVWAGAWGLFFSLLGSLSGGLLASRVPLLAAVFVTALLRIGPLAGQWWLTTVEPSAWKVLPLICAENFFGGALTTAMFAFMMSQVDRRIGATHFAVLATIEVWGKIPAGWLAGWLADRTSYSLVFGIGVLESVLFLLLLVPLEWNSRKDHPNSVGIF